MYTMENKLIEAPKTRVLVKEKYDFGTITYYRSGQIIKVKL